MNESCNTIVTPVTIVTQPEIVIHEIHGNPHVRRKIGSFKRKVKGREYKSARLLLPSEYANIECCVFEGKASIVNVPFLQNKTVLIIVLRK